MLWPDLRGQKGWVIVPAFGKSAKGRSWVNMTKENTDLNVAIPGLYTIQGPLFVDDDEWYADDTVCSSSLDHLFYTIQCFCGFEKLDCLEGI